MKTSNLESSTQQPTGLKAIGDYLGPINTICFLGIGLLDLLTPIIGRTVSLIILMIGIFGLIAMVFNVAWQETKLKELDKRNFFRSKKFFFSIFVILFASILLFAKALSTSSNSSAAGIAPKFVNSVQSTLGILQDQNSEISSKLDQVQAGLNDLKTDKLKLMTLIDLARAQYEDSIKAKVASYEKLSKNQKEALFLVQSQLSRMKQQDKAKALYRFASDYATNPSKETRNGIVTELTKLFPVTTPGDQRAFLGSMFLDNQTFSFLIGESKKLVDPSLLVELKAEDLLVANDLARRESLSIFLAVSEPSTNPGTNETWPLKGMDGNTYIFERARGKNDWELKAVQPPKP
jgi:hypothetical protein